MKCQSLFSGKMRKILKMFSAKIFPSVLNGNRFSLIFVFTSNIAAL